MKEPLQLALIFAAALAAGGTVYFLADNGRPSPKSWLPWALLAMGAFSVLNAVFDRNQKPDMKRIDRTNAILFLLGPTGSRILFGLIGGAFLGGAIALFVS